MEEGGCDDMACDGEQVVTISGYEDVAANDEQRCSRLGAPACQRRH